MRGCAHWIAEEAPEALLAELFAFFEETSDVVAEDRSGE